MQRCVFIPGNALGMTGMKSEPNQSTWLLKCHFEIVPLKLWHGHIQPACHLDDKPVFLWVSKDVGNPLNAPIDHCADRFSGWDGWNWETGTPHLCPSILQILTDHWWEDNSLWSLPTWENMDETGLKLAKHWERPRWASWIGHMKGGKDRNGPQHCTSSAGYYPLHLIHRHLSDGKARSLTSL